MNQPGNVINDDTNGEPEVRALAPYREAPSQFPIEADWNPEERKLGLRDYWQMVRCRIWLIAAIALLVTTLSVVYVAQQPDIYEATARIQVDLENNPPLEGKTGSVIIKTQGDETAYLNTQLLLLRSPAFLRRVVKTLSLEQESGAFSWDSGSRNSTWSNILGLAGLTESDAPSQKEMPLRATTIAPMSDDSDSNPLQQEDDGAPIRGGLDVKVAETSRLINISFKHSSPNAAAKVANVVADTFVQANWERRVKSTTAAGDFLKKRIDELHVKIGENEKKLIQYAKDHEILPMDSSRDIQSDRIAALDRELLGAENARKAAESEYQAALMPGAAAAIVAASNNLSPVETKLTELRQRRSVMLIEVGENWPEVKVLDKQISDLEVLLKNTRERAISVVLTNLETHYRQALSREQSLRKAFEQEHSDAMAQDAAAIDYRMIQHETTTYRALLDSLLQRSKENDIVLAATPNNVQVTDYATRPVVPVGPKRLQIVFLAFAASLAFGIGFAVLIGSLEDSIPVDSIERVERMFGLPTLAVIPQANGRRQLRGLQFLQRSNGNGHSGLVLYEEPGSPLVEAYKKLRTSVLLSDLTRAQKTLLVTSSMPAEGKTSAVINLGLVLAQTGAKVLVIDGDLRHPSLHQNLGASNEKGLSTILSHNLSEAAAFSLIEQREGTNLFILPSGPVPDNPAELLSSKRMKRLLNELSGSFSHIIIDSPPVSFFTDAVLVSSLVDGVLMVVRGPKSPGEAARYSLQTLDAAGAQILGVVLNGVNLRSNRYSYYRTYYGRLGPASSEIRESTGSEYADDTAGKSLVLSFDTTAPFEEFSRRVGIQHQTGVSPEQQRPEGD
jgi:polysaccharide biosynthesis transport protein